LDQVKQHISAIHIQTKTNFKTEHVCLRIHCFYCQVATWG